ncbi:MAG: helix-turn-helix transcriptional regulator [Opitutaceae bacterium]|nr:helix-turn-helix transcriptional regulator [Opitutaceae bacterium]MBP9899811.1 helix-turn-helix transcriptional regulator [Verrucomicrobiota bacterium]
MKQKRALQILRQNIRYARLNLDLSQEAFAERAGLTLKHFQDIESGRRQGVRLSTILCIAATLKLEVWQLFKEASVPQPTRERAHRRARIKR